MSVRPDLKGKTVYFFPTLDKYFEGVLIYEVKEKKAYMYNAKRDCKFNIFSKWISYLKNQKCFKGNRSANANIFLKPNPSSPSIASILHITDYIQY